MELEELIKPTVIIERKLTFNEKTTNWTWSSPKRHKYRKPISTEHLSLIKNLLECEDLHRNDIVSIIRKCESEVFRKPTIDNKFWEPQTLAIGQVYHIPPKMGNTKWCKAKLIAIENEVLKLVTLNTMVPVTLNARFVAHEEPVKEFLKVGTRVLTLVHKVMDTGEMFRGQKVHILGVVAEVPTGQNRYRYLVILDSGWWTYVQYTCLWPLCLQPLKVWKFIPKQTQRMVKNYLNGAYPTMVDYQKGDIIRCSVSDIGLNDGLVLHVDASVVVFWSQKYSMAVSMYRGLPHFRKL